MRAGWVVVMLAGCFHSLRPGETRCTSRPVFGTMVTECQTGQAEPPPVQPTIVDAPASRDMVADMEDDPGWTCIGITSNEHHMSSCFRERRQCFAMRDQAKERGETAEACQAQRQAACFKTGDVKLPRLCMATMADCREVHDEQLAGADGPDAVGDCKPSL